MIKWNCNTHTHTHTHTRTSTHKMIYIWLFYIQYPTCRVKEAHITVKRNIHQWSRGKLPVCLKKVKILTSTQETCNCYLSKEFYQCSLFVSIQSSSWSIKVCGFFFIFTYYAWHSNAKTGALWFPRLRTTLKTMY